MIWRDALRLAHDRRGATIVEFALVLPVLLLTLFGFSEFAYEMYVKAVLTGAVQEAGRASTIQGASERNAEIDQNVMTAVWTVAKGATYASSRKSYSQFTVMAPEPFNDANSNGVRNPGECFSDVNGNGVWDADPARTGLGGASDISVYTMTINFPQLFPIDALVGMDGSQTMSAATTLKNQPYATQTVNTVLTVCS